MWYESVVDSGYVPDFALRYGIRQLLSLRLASMPSNKVIRHSLKMDALEQLRKNQIAVHTDKANEQHYEVPTDFIKLCLGKRMKYSCCLFPPGVTNLDDAETKMLELYCEKAKLEDGLELLDLGCGWGSLTLFLAEKYPNMKITSLSNSATQKKHIDAIAKQRGFKNINVITADVQAFDTTKRFDRILSIEMLEHMKNYDALFKKISLWLKPEAYFFCHIFAHRNFIYSFETDEQHSWMAQHFFTGGTMPSADLFLYFQDSMSIKGHWLIDGVHYGKTAEEWLKLLDKNTKEALEILGQAYGNDQAQMWLSRWRTFYVSVAETFAYRNGEEWLVSLFLFQK